MRLDWLGVIWLASSVAWADASVERAPAAGHREFLEWQDEAGELALGWKPIGVHVDLDRAVRDRDYANRVFELVLPDGGDEAEHARAVNVLVDAKTHRIITELDRERRAYRACVRIGERGANHCDLHVHWDAASKLAIVTLDAKWNTAAVSVYLLRDGKNGLEVEARSPLVTDQLEHDTLRRLDEKSGRDKKYREARHHLSLTFEPAQSKSTDGIKRVSFAAGGEVPKSEDSFGFQNESLTYRVRQKGDALTLELEPPARN